MKSDAESKGVSFNLSIEQGSDQKIHTDPIRITQVITNLVSNAIKYGGGHPVSISLSSSRTEIILSVTDSGKGIEKSELERIFDRFERANDDSRISGLGLGLYILKLIVSDHDGSLLNYRSAHD